MLNILEIPDEILAGIDLGKPIAQEAVVHELETESDFWNRATIITLSRELTNEKESALIYLLQKEAKHLGLWEKEFGSNIPSAKTFIATLLVWGRFSNTKGLDISVQEFWKAYNNTITGIISEPSFKYFENGKAKPYAELLQLEQIEQVICFDNAWNEQNFLIKTAKGWKLFSWLTMA